MPAAEPSRTASAPTPAAARGLPGVAGLTALAAPLLVAAVALWLSFGAIAPADPFGPRVAAVPGFGWLAASIAAALASAAILRGRVRPRALAPLYLALLLWLPWLPGPVPDAFLLWQGPAARLVWLAIAIGLAAPHAGRLFGWIGRRTPRRQRALAFAVSFVVYVGAAWQMAPVLPGGDEPHYLIVAQSLLYDRDLRIENNHQRRDYASYLEGEIKPHYLRRGVDREIYSIHAPGLGALVAPAFALAGYPGVVVFLGAVSAFGMALLWWTVWRMTTSSSAAWIAWAAAALSAPFFFQAFTVFPDAPGAVLAIVGVSALAVPERSRRTRWLLACGLAVAALPWLHTRYAAIAGMLGVLLVLRAWKERAHRGPLAALALPLTVPPLVSAALWFWFFHAIYGTVNPAAPYGGYTQSGPEKIPNGLTGLLVDQQFGILPYAPVYLAAALGIWALWRTSRRLAVEIVLVAVPYAALVASYHMWWGGRSSPARFLVPILPILSFGLAALWQRTRHQWVKAAIVTLVVLSAATAVALAWVDRGALVYNTRDGYGLWLEALAPSVHLPLALPSLFRGSWPAAWGFAALWLMAAAVAAGLLKGSGRWLSGDREWTAASAAALALAAMAGVSFGWIAADRRGADVASARWTALRGVAAGHRVLIYEPLPRAVNPTGALDRLEVPASARRPPDGQLFFAQGVPPGRYEIRVHSHTFLEGALRVQVGHAREPILVAPLAGGTPSSHTLRLPAGARSLAIGADEEARRTVAGVTLRPVRLDGGASTAPELARAAARYGSTIAHFVDDRAYVEPAGFWVRAASEAIVFFQTDAAPDGLPLLLRNGAVTNQVRVASGDWGIDLNLAGGEERVVHVPMRGSDAARVSIRSEGGFRPAEHDPRSRDVRRLGVWVEVRDRQAGPRDAAPAS